MSVVTRAKFRLIAEKRYAYGDAVEYTFQPQYDSTVPEDLRFAKYTPSGEVRISVDNPAVKFEVGADYYLDFTLVPAAEPAAENTATA